MLARLFLRRIAGSLTKKIGKSGQNQLFRSRFSILGQAPHVFFYHHEAFGFFQTNPVIIMLY
jgi:hypothetical protein